MGFGLWTGLVEDSFHGEYLTWRFTLQGENSGERETGGQIREEVWGQDVPTTDWDCKSQLRAAAPWGVSFEWGVSDHDDGVIGG